MAKYRNKSIIIDIEQFFPDKKPWPKGVYVVETGNGPIDRLNVISRKYQISTLEGETEVLSGDFIIHEIYRPR